jgi:nitrate/nitrite transporter NarK
MNKQLLTALGYLLGAAVLLPVGLVLDILGQAFVGATTLLLLTFAAKQVYSAVQESDKKLQKNKRKKKK